MLKNRQDLIDLRAACRDAAKKQTRKILVCTGAGCVSSGSLDIYARLVELLRERGIPCEVELAKDPHDDSVRVTKGGCPGFCEIGPLVRIDPEGYLYTKVKVSDCEEIIDKTIVAGELVERLAYKKDGKVYAKKNEIPFYQKQKRLVLEHCGEIDSDSIREYLSVGGYTAFEKALFDMSHEDGRYRQRDQRVQPARARGRRIPHRQEVEPGEAPESHAEIHRLQRRRGRPRRVHGPLRYGR